MKNDQKLNIGKAANFLNVSIDTLRRWDKSGKLPAQKSSGGHRFYYVFDLKLFKQDISVLAEEWVLGIPREPKKEFYCPTSVEFKGRLSRLENDLSKIENLKEFFPLVSAIVGEIGNNSFDHNFGNWPDVPGIFFVYDVKKRQIVLADRGRGVLKTLKKVKPELEDDSEALEVAFVEIISARAPEARGNGLKFVRQTISNSSSLKLSFFSGHARLMVEHGREMEIEGVKNYHNGCLALINY